MIHHHVAVRHVSLALFILLLTQSRSEATSAGGTLPRDDDIVVVPGSSLPDFLGRVNSDLGAFKYDPASLSFVPIPTQVDERVNHVFSAGTSLEVVENIYDVFHEDDGLLDADDEVAFLFGDGGPQAPSSIAWPVGAEPERFDITVTDPRPDSNTVRWVYLFSGANLPRSSTQYVSWSGTRNSSISTSLFSLDFSDRWLLTGLRVLVPCGTAADLIDRLKGRGGITPQGGETEENWNDASSFMGGIVGLVRAIRYVQGAASGVNTVHHDVVSRSRWQRTVNLRVHPINEVWLYFDLLPNAGATLFTPATPSGMPVDGVRDPAAPTALQPWTLLRSGLGGYVTINTIPPSPYYRSAESYFLDDASYNDAPVTDPNYSDEDNSAYGNNGVTLKALTGSETTTIPLFMKFYPLCSNVGDSNLGSSYQQLDSYPLALSSLPTWTVGGPVRTLQARPKGSDVVLSWEALAAVTSYKIYVSPFADLAHPSWGTLAQVTATHYCDRGAEADAQNRYYSVVAVTPAGEGPW
ncbi:MAG: hypothetical protein DMF49_11750 [Acidobacteria bacterium]|nr:MAG: hypothetical protein DMF49_11750 [Acidobacteriota bacterium]